LFHKQALYIHLKVYKNNYIYWAKECPGIFNAEVYPLHGGPGTVKVVVSGENRMPVDDEILENFFKKLRIYCSLIVLIWCYFKTLEEYGFLKKIFCGTDDPSGGGSGTGLACRALR
jgi:hypothetical protein